jgi:hypothetical protein
MLERRLSKLTLNRPTRLILTAALSLGVGATGCGSTNKSTTTATTAAITKAEFLTKGNAICTRGNLRLGAAQGALGNKPSQAQITAFVKSKFGPDIQSQIDAIRALGAPPSEQATVTSMLNLAQADLSKVESNPALLASGPPFVDFAKAARSYGLTACARNN